MTKPTTLKELFGSDMSVQIHYRSRRMFFLNISSEWCVVEDDHSKKDETFLAVTLYHGASEAEAIAALVGE